MNTRYFTDLLTEKSDFDKTMINELVSHCTIANFKKGQMVLQRGNASLNSYYVQKGLLRYYSVDGKGREHILQFAPEGWFVSDRQNGSDVCKSDFFIDALEDTEAVVLNHSFLNGLAEENKRFLEYNNKLLHNHIRQLQARINELLSYTAEERYVKFVQTYTDITLRVPQAMIASYLGITPESLSRVRKELAIRNRN